MSLLGPLDGICNLSSSIFFMWSLNLSYVTPLLSYLLNIFISNFLWKDMTLSQLRSTYIMITLYSLSSKYQWILSPKARPDWVNMDRQFAKLISPPSKFLDFLLNLVMKTSSKYIEKNVPSSLELYAYVIEPSINVLLLTFFFMKNINLKSFIFIRSIYWDIFDIY